MSKILFITTNFSTIKTNTASGDIYTGVYLEEFASPYLVFEATGYDLTVASPLGGVSPLDESSLNCSNPMEWDVAANHLKETEKLGDIEIENYDALFFPGGHGPMFDIAQDNYVAEVVEYFYEHDKIIAAVCHGVAGLINAKTPEGCPIVAGKTITALTNKEEEIAKMTEFVPFLLETKLVELGADFVADKPWAEHVEIDGKIITGQNQNSALLAAEEVIKILDGGD